METLQSGHLTVSFNVSTVCVFSSITGSGSVGSITVSITGSFIIFTFAFAFAFAFDFAIGFTSSIGSSIGYSSCGFSLTISSINSLVSTCSSWSDIFDQLYLFEQNNFKF